MCDPPARLPYPFRRIILACLLVASFLSIRASEVPGSELRQTPIVKAIQRARPSVVNIRGEKTIAETDAQTSRTGAGRRVNGMGTGVVVDQRGYIVTNYHVVDGVREIQVTLADGQRHVATLVARDSETDLAVIKINSEHLLPVIDIGRSDDLMTGEPVVAVGNAYGYEHTVTRGIISALHRAVQVSDAQGYADLIQTDASINPGNSGGPLLNVDGQMIGVNVAVRAGAQGIGFAIPIDKVVKVCSELLRARSVETSWHGVVLDAEPDKDGDGLRVNSVDKESPAGRAGLQAGDVVTAVEHAKLRRSLDFHRAMLERKAGEKIELSIRRGKSTLQKTLTLAAAPAESKTSPKSCWKLLGLRLEPIPKEQFRKRFRTSYRGGLAVDAVRENGPAAIQGIRPGDVLVGMHVWETVSLENISYILSRAGASDLDPIKVYILRGGDTLYSYLPLTVQTASKQH